MWQEFLLSMLFNLNISSWPLSHSLMSYCMAALKEFDLVAQFGMNLLMTNIGPFSPPYPHGHRSLVGCSPWDCKIRHDWTAKHGIYSVPRPIPEHSTSKKFDQNLRWLVKRPMECGKVSCHILYQKKMTPRRRCSKWQNKKTWHSFSPMNTSKTQLLWNNLHWKLTGSCRSKPSVPQQMATEDVK